MKTYLEEQKKWNETTYDGKHKEKKHTQEKKKNIKMWRYFSYI